jgi:molybdopterin-containing oxidoreductase family iron-sulfur binding subunit
MSSLNQYWRSLRERAGEPIDDGGEFPVGADVMDGATRRDFLKLLGGTAVLSTATVAGCFANPPDKVLPYSKQPVEVTPGNPLHYATTLTLDGYGTGVVVAAREGRPIKVEGNPDHPASLGASGVFEQAALWHLYDPQRARTLKHSGKPRAFNAFVAEAAALAARHKQDGGARLRFLVEPSGSPLVASLRAEIQAAFPQARFYAWAPAVEDYEGTRLAFGRPLETRRDFDRARTIVALDADFLVEGPFCHRYARQFADHRVPENELNRLYVAEARYSLTGAAADHRLRLRSSEIEALARALLGAIAPERAQPNNPFAGHAWVKAAAADLRARPTTGLVLAGARQPPVVRAIAAAINAALGSTAVAYSAPVLSDTALGTAALVPLVEELRAGAVDTLVVTAYNPVYTAPADVELGELLSRVPNGIYHGLFDDETARHSTWFLPAAHELESWGDARALDGTVSLQQPLIAPLFGGVSGLEVLAAFVGKAEHGTYRLLRDDWQRRHAGADFASWWDHTVQRGVVADSALPTENAAVEWDRLGAALSVARPAPPGGLEINFVPDVKLHDGRFADNAWLQELPDPMSKLAWGNALQLGPATASRLALANGDQVEIALGARTLRAPVLVLPGVADESAVLALGYGRAGGEMIARDIGANGYRLRTVAAPWFAGGASLSRTGARVPLAITQEHWTMDGRPAALEVTTADLSKKHLPLVDSQKEELPTLYNEVEYPGYKWAMAIDLSRCSGCGACSVACSSENNVLIVGPEQVRRGREMQWIRIDRYFAGAPDSPDAVMQPVACVHCENAPCEYVCPVNATVHSDEGLNEMVYNRCVGTRYCSNNCPYKVRRFNYLNFHSNLQGTEEMAMNPDVSVRARGVMEKCTYCVQRIERARIASRIDGHTGTIRDGEFTTACAQACPSQAIVFGSLHDPESRVSKRHSDARSYSLLHSLGTRPRTVHLARIRNRNPELG